MGSARCYAARLNRQTSATDGPLSAYAPDRFVLLLTAPYSMRQSASTAECRIDEATSLKLARTFTTVSVWGLVLARFDLTLVSSFKWMSFKERRIREVKPDG
jgi:hypothetical protein